GGPAGAPGASRRPHRGAARARPDPVLDREPADRGRAAAAARAAGPARAARPARAVHRRRARDPARGHAGSVRRAGARARLRARLRIELPDVPLAHVDLSSTPAAFALDIFTTLPVAAGVAPAPPSPDAILVQIAGDTAALAANWGIEHGALPPRYTRKLKPDQ